MNRTTLSPSPTRPKSQQIPICIALLSGRSSTNNSPHNSIAFSQSSDGSATLSPERPPLYRSATGSAYAHPSYLWDNGREIFYCFLDGTDRQKYKVESVMHEWMWYANIIFVRKPDEDESAAFRITFEGDGSWCFIGKTALNQKTGPTMQFDQISDEEKTVDSERGTILHEFGHALGLLHEHQGPGAARALDWNEDEVLEWYRNRGYDDRFIRNNVLFMFSKRTQPSNYNAFDPRSIMVYRINPEFNSAGLAADLNCNLSDMDKAYMVINYPRPDPHPQASRWTLHHALKVAGVPKRIIREWKDLPPSSIRDKFSAYQEAEREASRLNIKCVETHISQKACFYKIICNANLSEFKRRSQVRRQYSQFEDFRAALADNVKDIPTLPGTGPFWTTWPCYRRKKLREWLCSLPKHPEFERIKSELRRFLQDEFYEIIRRDVE
ncbi:hypothetical protein FB45DRAFT_68644 [Roridomyces roridus]|uniref:Peptidase M12A domain-containing protein n=1 Tax=Roridomyces roridus TaxID=1738132 RepID=A0AAD7BNB1_9AGAR|nr:hypothetical protein FB45DRAFT_68644 [Roridomyces roridus]